MKKWLKTTLITITCLLVLAAAGATLYLSDYYRADDIAVAAMAGSNMKTQDNLTILTPTTPSDTGLIFYPGGKVEHALTLYGSEDKVMDREKLTYTENVVEIAGGNHAQFGNYGVQTGDGTATISAAEQQAQTVDSIAAFMQKG